MLQIFDQFYSTDLLRSRPNDLFVFGDNGDRMGNGGQAIIRDEPNALGVATLPRLGVPARDGDPFMLRLMGTDMLMVESRLRDDRTVVMPVTAEGRISLGCGIANLPYHAPCLYMMLERWFDRLKKEYLDVQG